MMGEPAQRWFQRWWVILILVAVAFMLGLGISGVDNSTQVANPTRPPLPEHVPEMCRTQWDALSTETNSDTARAEYADCLTAAQVLALGDPSPTTENAPRTTLATTTVVITTLAQPPAVTTPAQSESAQVVRVIDGDTMVVLASGQEHRVRLIGINSPESDECLAVAAGQLLTTLAGASVRLEADREDTDSFGRLLRYVWADDVLINQVLVAQGMAISRAFPPNTSRQATLDRAQNEAIANRAGLWAPDACGPPTGVQVEIVQIQSDPPGPDEDDLNGEYVVVRNLGEQPADLGGFTLRDTSSSNRYKFPRQWQVAAGETVTIHVGQGNDRPGSLYWNSRQPVWNNNGDAAFLLDPSGNLVAYRAYDG